MTAEKPSYSLLISSLRKRARGEAQHKNNHHKPAQQLAAGVQGALVGRGRVVDAREPPQQQPEHQSAGVAAQARPIAGRCHLRRPDTRCQQQALARPG